MILSKINTIYILVVIMLFVSCKKTTPKIVQEKTKTITSLPYIEMNLEGLADFTTDGANWKVVEKVTSNFNKEHDIKTEEGTGVLVNENTKEHKSHIFSIFEHGDIELDIEFMIPKGSNSGIYFQSRYEIQLLDSWGKENLTAQDCGSVYQRWDDTRPEGEKGYEGHPLLVYGNTII